VDNIRWDGVMWTGFVCLRIGTGGELLWIRYWTFECPWNAGKLSSGLTSSGLSSSAQLHRVS
jgi:hypothetical protein